MRDGVDADVVSASMRGAPRQLDVDPGKSAVSGTNRETRRLGDDHGVGGDATIQQRPGAEALVLLIDDGGDEDSALRIRLRSEYGCGTHRGDAAFHVGRA